MQEMSHNIICIEVNREDGGDCSIVARLIPVISTISLTLYCSDLYKLIAFFSSFSFTLGRPIMIR